MAHHRMIKCNQKHRYCMLKKPDAIKLLHVSKWARNVEILRSRYVDFAAE